MSILDLLEEVKRNRQKRKCSETIKNTAIGVAVGVAAGVLLAPKSGKETREELVKVAREIPNKVKEVSERKEG